MWPKALGLYHHFPFLAHRHVTNSTGALKYPLVKEVLLDHTTLAMGFGAISSCRFLVLNSILWKTQKIGLNQNWEDSWLKQHVLEPGTGFNYFSFLCPLIHQCDLPKLCIMSHHILRKNIWWPCQSYNHQKVSLCCCHTVTGMHYQSECSICISGQLLFLSDLWWCSMCWSFQWLYPCTLSKHLV